MRIAAPLIAALALVFSVGGTATAATTPGFVPLPVRPITNSATCAHNGLVVAFPAPAHSTLIVDGRVRLGTTVVRAAKNHRIVYQAHPGYAFQGVKPFLDLRYTVAPKKAC